MIIVLIPAKTDCPAHRHYQIDLQPHGLIGLLVYLAKHIYVASITYHDGITMLLFFPISHKLAAVPIETSPFHPESHMGPATKMIGAAVENSTQARSDPTTLP